MFEAGYDKIIARNWIFFSLCWSRCWEKKTVYGKSMWFQDNTDCLGFETTYLNDMKYNKAFVLSANM